MTIGVPALPLALAQNGQSTSHTLTALFQSLAQNICEKLSEIGVSANAKVIELSNSFALIAHSESDSLISQMYGIQFDLNESPKNKSNILVKINHMQKTIFDNYGSYIENNYNICIGEQVYFFDSSAYGKSFDPTADWIQDTICRLIASKLTSERSQEFLKLAITAQAQHTFQ
ncbi:MAG: hypothetical protein JNK24_00935 [Alphaproteobacteria bacterium]|nr:hypothetical protein [Alphaproteobacteria bacterium]